MFATCVWFILQGNQGQIWNQLIKLVILIYNIFGVALHNPNCLKRNKWLSQGIMGEILQELRDTIRNTPPNATSITDDSSSVIPTPTNKVAPNRATLATASALDQNPPTETDMEEETDK